MHILVSPYPYVPFSAIAARCIKGVLKCYSEYKLLKETLWSFTLHNHSQIELCLMVISVPVAQWLEYCVSSAEVVGSIPRNTHTDKTMYNLNAL